MKIRLEKPEKKTLQNLKKIRRNSELNIMQLILFLFKFYVMQIYNN